MSDLSASKSYILNINQVDESELDLGGEKAVNLGQLARLGAPVLAGFIVTSKVFDDFLFANNFISQIGEINRQVARGQLAPAKAENAIGRLIMSGGFPNLTEEMLNRAYSLLSNGNKITVSISFSAVNPQLKESLKAGQNIELLADSYEMFLERLKLSWTALFSKEAIKSRLEKKYKGILTQAIVVNKYQQPEVSGDIYTLAVDNADPSITEIRAVFGYNYPGLKMTFNDRYLYEKSTEEILEKFKNEQEWMLVAKGGRFEKVAIAKSRKENPKLTQSQILKLAKTTTKLKEYFKNELKISWEFHGGKFVFTEMTRLTEQDLLEARTLLTTNPQNTKKRDDANQGFKLQPLNDLTAVAVGNGNNKGVVYGRVKIIRNQKDLESAQGINILVCPKVFRGLDLSLVRYRGLIIENILKYDESELPAVSGVEDATNLLLENEVVTMDTSTGKIYLGAGYEPVNRTMEEVNVTAVEPASKNLNTIHLSMHRPLTQGIYKRTGLKQEETESQWLPDTVVQTSQTNLGYENPQIQTLSNKIEEEWYLKKPILKGDEIIDENTSFGYWQMFNISDPVALSGTEGVYVSLGSIMQALDLDKYELSRNKPLKLKFLNFCAEYFESFLDMKQIALLLDINKTAKETLSEENVLDLQLEIVKFLRNKSNLKNISIILPDVRTEKDLITMKKAVTSIGLRRSSTFNIFIEIASPLAAISLRNMVEDGLDGMIIDLDKFLFALYEEEKYRMTEEVTEFLVDMIQKVTRTSAKLLLAANKVVLNDDDLKDFVKAGLSNFVFPDRKIIELGGIISNIEIKNLTTKKKGRKQKTINYK